MDTLFCSGNEAIGIGALKSGIKIACGYPGAPITPALDYIIKADKVYTEWSINEKVAYETALGASIRGCRSLTVMKTLGLNVAADALTQSIGGFLQGGMVIAVADDTGREEGDDFQDCRYYGIISEIPVLEPGSCQEIFEYVQWGFEISEVFGIPVLLRMNSVTTRIKEAIYEHPIDLSILAEFSSEKDKNSNELYFGQKTIFNVIKFGFKDKSNKKLSKYLMDYSGRFERIKHLTDCIPINEIQHGTGQIGFITSGILYQYCKEVFPEAGYLKLGMINPIPEKLVSEFVSKYDNVFIVEEIYPIIENSIKALGFTQVLGKEVFGLSHDYLHLTPELIFKKVNRYINKSDHYQKQCEEQLTVPMRLPQNCPGCPHLFTYQILKDMGVDVVSGIGCCGLSALPIMNSSNILQSMGSPAGIAHGFNKMQDSGVNKLLVAVIGDGEFWHSGILGLINAINNKSNIKIIILDNNVIGMTGGQYHPSSQSCSESDPPLDIKKICVAMGIKSVYEVDPYNYEIYSELLKNELVSNNPSVIIAKRKCTRLYKEKRLGFCFISEGLCIQCGHCLNTGCAAIEKKADVNGKRHLINIDLCVGCRLCLNICPAKAITFRSIKGKYE